MGDEKPDLANFYPFARKLSQRRAKFLNRINCRVLVTCSKPTEELSPKSTASIAPCNFIDCEAKGKGYLDE